MKYSRDSCYHPPYYEKYIILQDLSKLSLRFSSSIFKRTRPPKSSVPLSLSSGSHQPQDCVHHYGNSTFIPNMSLSLLGHLAPKDPIQIMRQETDFDVTHHHFFSKASYEHTSLCYLYRPYRCYHHRDHHLNSSASRLPLLVSLSLFMIDIARIRPET